MREVEVTKFIISAANGDELAREKLIKHYKPYIINTVGHICKRFVTWSDEESSIGLIAFNRAIDTYKVDSQKTFLNYVYLLIKRELIDYFRKESNSSHVPLDINNDTDKSTINIYEIEKSMQSFEQSLKQSELIDEILEFSGVLKEYNVSFEELEYFSPKHRKTKIKLLNIANNLVQTPSLVETFIRKKRLPVTALKKQFGYREKTMERHRKYLVTLTVLKIHPEWRQLSEYVQVPLGNEGVL